ncbi:MAG: hypothetical protein AAB922_01900 [Patescibacteria group bacterium]
MGNNNKNKVGRPQKITKEVLQKLKDAFKLGCTDRESCFYADICERTLYYYQEKYPDFLQEKELLKTRLTLKARMAIAQAIENNDINISKWYLERHDSDSAEKVRVEHSGSMESGSGTPTEDKEALAEFYKRLKENRSKRRLEKAKQDGEIPG